MPIRIKPVGCDYVRTRHNRYNCYSAASQQIILYNDAGKEKSSTIILFMVFLLTFVIAVLVNLQ